MSLGLWPSVGLVSAGAFVGSIARVAISQWTTRKYPRLSFPLGTLFVNLTGAFLLGWMYGADASSTVKLLLGTGFMGAYTTFSTFTYESLQMGLNKRWVSFAVYLGMSATLGILLAYLGVIFGESMIG